MQLSDLMGKMATCGGPGWILFDTEEQKMLVLMVSEKEAIFVGLSDIGGCSSERTEIMQYIKDSYKILRSVT